MFDIFFLFNKSNYIKIHEVKKFLFFIGKFRYFIQYTHFLTFFEQNFFSCLWTSNDQQHERSVQQGVNFWRRISLEPFRWHQNTWSKKVLVFHLQDSIFYTIYPFLTFFEQNFFSCLWTSNDQQHERSVQQGVNFWCRISLEQIRWHQNTWSKKVLVFYLQDSIFYTMYPFLTFFEGNFSLAAFGHRTTNNTSVVLSVSAFVHADMFALMLVPVPVHVRACTCEWVCTACMHARCMHVSFTCVIAHFWTLVWISNDQRTSRTKHATVRKFLTSFFSSTNQITSKHVK